MNKYIFDAGKKRELSGPALLIKNCIALITSIYLIVSVFIYPEQIFHRTTCFGLFFSILFLTYSTPGIKDTKNIPWYDWVFAASSLMVSIYMAINLDRLVDRLPYIAKVYISDYIFAFITLVLLFEGTRRIIGHWISSLGLLSLLYAFFGQYIPGRFGHHGFSLSLITDGLFLNTHGIWGSAIGIATNQIMIFIIFGSFFLYSGAGDYIFNFASALVKGRRGGVAKIAVITSAMFGMISGSPVSNVATMGSLTIPAMKKQGYSSEFAASVESCSSVGGIFMPPIMGSVAFIMADVVGIPYVKIAYSAFFPALLYFFAIFMIIDIKSRSLKTQSFTPQYSPPSHALMLKRGFVFFLPLTFLIVRLMMGITPSRVGVESIALLILVNIKTFNPNKIVAALINGIDKGLMIVSTMATSGILIGIINTTGISSKFSSVLISMAGQSLFITLILVMFMAMFLGLAMNITPSYLLTAVMTVPILVRFGVEPLSAHMFVLFFAAMATITPPVAITSFTAATIAGASPMGVGFKSMRMALVAYILPYVFVYNPSILLIGSASKIATTFILSAFSVAVLTLSVEGGELLGSFSKFKQLILFVSSVMIFSNIFYFIVIGIIISIIVIATCYKKNYLKGENS